MSNTFYNEILIEHNLHPTHKHELPDANLVLEGVNPSCGDDIWLKLKVENDEIVDGAFVGDGCAISQASADMMLDLIIGKKKDEALRLANLFLEMIKLQRAMSWNLWRKLPSYRMCPICRRGSSARCWDGIRWRRCLRRQLKGRLYLECR